MHSSHEAAGPLAPRKPEAGPDAAKPLYLVAYDISSPRRLRNVASTYEDFGFRRQFPVFVCRLTATDLVQLKSRLYEIIDLGMDQVIFVPLCARCSEQIEALGRPTEPPDARDVVIVS